MVSKRTSWGAWLLWMSVLLVAGTLGVRGSARAEGNSVDDLERKDQSKFRKLVDQCAREYNSERFDRAEALCAEAKALAPHPITLYTIARIRDRSNRCEEAVGLYGEILSTTPPGPSEKKWLDEEGAAVKKHFDYLGNCKPRVLATCSDSDGIVVVDGQVAGLCGQPIEVSAGTRQVTLVSTKRAPESQTLQVNAGAPTEMVFKSLPPLGGASQPHQLKTECQDFPQGAALVVDKTVVGACPMTLDLAAGSHRVTALGPGGLRGAAQADTAALPPEPLVIFPMQTLSVVCADAAEVHVSLKIESLGEQVEGLCQDLSERPIPITLPRGDYEVALTRPHYETETRPLKVTADVQPTLRVGGLLKSPVGFTVSTPSGVSAAQVKIDSQVGSLPWEGKLPEGTYNAEVRAEGHKPALFTVSLVHPGPQVVESAALEPLPVWTPGLITTISGGALLATGFIYDMATLPRLNEFKTLAADGSGDADLARYNELKSQVETDIVATQVLYGVGFGVALTGGGLMLYEYLTRPPGDFTGDNASATTELSSSQLSVAPLFAPQSGTTGLALHWVY